jgi:hypothetical protein
MFSEQIELRGHIIDSLILPKVLDEILAQGGTFNIEEVRLASNARIPLRPHHCLGNHPEAWKGWSETPSTAPKSSGRWKRG